MKPIKVEIMPFGFSVSFSLSILDYNKKIINASIIELKKVIVAISGPTINLLIILILKFMDIEFVQSNILIYANSLIMIFNLLPIYPLDGGRILKGIIHIFFGGKMAKIITNKTSNIMMIILTFAGSIGVYYFQNISIFIIIVYLWWIVICENKKYKLIISAYEQF